MSDLLLLISEYGLHLFIGIGGLAAICVFAVRNAEDCSLPTECFDCNEVNCRTCHRSKQAVQTGQWVWKPDLEHAPMLTGTEGAGQETAWLPSE